jgi:transposase
VEIGRPRLTFLREKFAELVAAGWTAEAAAKAVRIHRATAYRWCDQMRLPKRSYRKAAKK